MKILLDMEWLLRYYLSWFEVFRTLLNILNLAKNDVILALWVEFFNKSDFGTSSSRSVDRNFWRGCCEIFMYGCKNFGEQNFRRTSFFDFLKNNPLDMPLPSIILSYDCHIDKVWVCDRKISCKHGCTEVKWYQYSNYHYG